MRSSRGVSLGGASRKYSDAGSIQGVKGDARHLKSQDTKRRHIEILQEFYSTKCPGLGLSPKAFVEPTGKDFAAMWTGVTQPLQFKGSKTKKLEENILECLKILRYPFALSRSSLGTPGATHAWPNIRAMLVWLIDLVKFSENLPQAELLSSESSNQQRHYLAGYVAFMTGDEDTLKELENARARATEQRQTELRDRLAAAKEKKKQVVESLQEERNMVSKRDAKQQDIDERNRDKRRIHSKIAQGKKSKSKCEQKLEQMNADLASSQSNREAVMQELSTVRQQVAAQKYTREDVEEFLNEKAQFKKQLEQLRPHSNIVKKELSDLRAKLQEGKYDIQQKVHEQNMLGTQLKSMSAVAKRAPGVDFGIGLSKDVQDGDLECVESFKRMIQPVAERLKQELEKKEEMLRSKAAVVSKDMKAISPEISKLKEDEQGQERQIGSLKQELESAKLSFETMKSSMVERMNVIQKELGGVHERRAEEVLQAGAAEKEAIQNYEESVQKWATELQEIHVTYSTRMEEIKMAFQNGVGTASILARDCLSTVAKVESFKKTLGH